MDKGEGDGKRRNLPFGRPVVIVCGAERLCTETDTHGTTINRFTDLCADIDFGSTPDPSSAYQSRHHAKFSSVHGSR
jgi:hypothetical protein